MAKTPTRTLRVPDALWNAAKLKAAEESTTLTAVLIFALEAYISDELHS